MDGEKESVEDWGEEWYFKKMQARGHQLWKQSFKVLLTRRVGKSVSFDDALIRISGRSAQLLLHVIGHHQSQQKGLLRLSL